MRILKGLDNLVILGGVMVFAVLIYVLAAFAVAFPLAGLAIAFVIAANWIYPSSGSKRGMAKAAAMVYPTRHTVTATTVRPAKTYDANGQPVYHYYDENGHEYYPTVPIRQRAISS